MRFRYSCVWVKVSQFSKQLMVVVGLLALPFTFKFDRQAAAKPVPSTPKPNTNPSPAVVPTVDLRTAKLRKFFGKLHCPITDMAEEFVHAADDNRIDWRLLPSISVIESGGGKAYRNNNVFGWNNGLQLFPTIRSGIQEVAYKLGRSPLYMNKDNVGKLHIYNPDEDYAPRVLSVMNQISPIVNLQPVRRMVRRYAQPAFAEN